MSPAADPSLHSRSAGDCLAALAPIRERLLAHPLYEEVTSLRRVQIFMEHHVFAVWDFMSLLKRLQQIVTCVTVPWVPSPHADLARFINEIVLGEECDSDGRGGYASHYELYLEAMHECGANPLTMESLVQNLGEGLTPASALARLSIPDGVRQFVLSNLQLASSGAPHEVAAAFFFGREDVIPEMFSRVAVSLRRQGTEVERLIYYVDRHIELDGDEHGPLARKLLESLCGDDPVRWEQATRTAVAALESRLSLWDATLQAIRQEGRSRQD
jgi:hypothetical protein